MPRENWAIALPHTYEIELPVFGRGPRCEIQRGTNRTNIHRFPKNVTAGNVFPINVYLPVTRRIIVQHSTQQRNMTCHFLFLGNLFFGLLILLLFFLRGPNVIGQQTRSGTLKKISLAPRPPSLPDVEGACFSAVQTRYDFFRRTGETEATRQIIGRTQRENAQWNAG